MKNTEVTDTEIEVREREWILYCKGRSKSNSSFRYTFFFFNLVVEVTKRADVPSIEG